MLGYLSPGNLFTVSFSTCVALVSMASAFMMPALAQLAGKKSVSQVYFVLFWKLLMFINWFTCFFSRAGNIVLLQFLVGQKQATEDDLVTELVVNVLKASPDVLARYFQETQYSYTPRPKSAWQDNVKLLKKVITATICIFNEFFFSNLA